ncbi:MAG: DEAD/DEAH box helicase [Atopobiaceae bacterium]|nr:DEAD/DEAH box helicase [Atopobiaceae bacterium]
MISEEALAAVCRPAILGRARIIARREGRIWERACSYEGHLTHISAHVDSASGYMDSYETSVTLDETDDTVHSYSCTCPAARKFSGPCKHSIALAIDFNRNGELYEGFSHLQHLSTSTAITSFLDRSARMARPRIASGAGEAPATVRVVPRLMHDNELFLGLRLAGTRGAYVVRDLGAFEAHVTEGSFFEYGKRLAFTHELGSFVEEDRELVMFVCRCVRNRRSYAGNRVYGHVYATSGSALSVGKELRLSPPEIDELLRLLRGRTVTYEPASGPQASYARDVTVADGDPVVSVELVPSGGDGFEMVRSGELEVFTTGEHMYALQESVLYRCTDRMLPAAPFLQQVYCSQSSSLLMTTEDARRFCVTALPAIEQSLQVTVPAELDALRPDPLRLVFLLDCMGNLVTCDALAKYGMKTVRLFDRAQGEQALWRDLRAEAEARSVVTRYFTTARESGVLVSRPDNDSIARIVFEGVPELSRLGEVRASEAFARLEPRRKPTVHVGATSRSGLFDLSLLANDIPQRELWSILGSYRMRKTYHRLRDGSFVDLRGVDLDEAARLADELSLTASELACGTVAIPSYKAFLLDALMPDDQKDVLFKRQLEEFRTVDVDGYEPPASLVEALRPYQIAGFKWLSALTDMGFGGILADEMGLGKSVQVISLLLACRGQGQSLIVCPASLVYNWVAEFEKFAPELDVAAVSGDAQERRRIRAQGGHEVLITSYDLLRRDIEDYASRRLWAVVLDEAQYIKNHQTLAARAVKTLVATHRFALTGTPVENRLSELWSIFDFLMPGLLGGYERFRDRYELPIADGDEDAARMLRETVSPFVLRRLKSEVLDDLPDKLEQVVACRMGRTQRELYDAREQALRMSLEGSSLDDLGTERMQVLAELTRLRQLCCDPRLVYEDYEGGSCKLDTIWQLVSSAMDAREKVLVFSQFTSFLSLIAERLDEEGMAYYTITGETPKKRRVELVDAFNADDTPVFLVSLRAGGTGLNLVGASVVIHADPWWNLAVQDQATDRAHRIGQTRDVTVYKVIAAHTIEERILMLQEAKGELAERFVAAGGGAASLGALSRDDLLRLLEE